MRAVFTRWFGALIGLVWRNWITMLGGSLATVCAVIISAFLVTALVAPETVPAYAGLVVYLILPAVFVGGLLLIPLGVYVDHRQRRKRLAAGDIAELPEFPTIDFNMPRTRAVAIVVLTLSAVNLFIISSVSYRAVVFTDSTEFCGTICHEVMEPEHTAFLDSPHSRVSCTECHIGAGASWYVRSKMSGVRQVFAVALDSFQRPVPSPVENLRPSRETCEECHWPDKFTGDVMRVVNRYGDDEENTLFQSVLLMHIGGGTSDTPGIHSWHIDPNKRVSYVTTDPKRQSIPVVRVKHADGSVTEYRSSDAEEVLADADHVEERVMDCIDCHNRPTHIFHMPGPAMDLSLTAGRLDASIPYVKKVGVEALEQVEVNAEDLARIAEHVRSYYQENQGEYYASNREAVEAAIQEIQAIYKRNVFPNMDLGWGTHPDNIGHTTSVGCFRCHDEAHETEAGEVIRQDCLMCHSVLAMEEEEPAILEELGMLR
jgi:NapC/NirT cytochrome c family protein